MQVRGIVAALPTAQRLVVDLAYTTRLSQRQIAERLGWPPATVAHRLACALQAVARALNDDEDDHHAD